MSDEIRNKVQLYTSRTGFDHAWLDLFSPSLTKPNTLLGYGNTSYGTGEPEWSEVQIAEYFHFYEAEPYPED
jgi:hypothetical protein